MESDDGWKRWSDEELEHQMSPSRWSPNKTPDEAIAQHIAFCTAETEKARKTLQYEANIAYGTETVRQKYDVYGTDLPDDAPIFFWIHGGYWQFGAKDFNAQMAVNLYEIGVKTLVLGYTIAPEATILKIKSEFYSALKHAMQRFKSSRFFIGGHSAGGHLTASLLHEKKLDKDFERLDLKNRVSGLLLCAGVFDLRLLVRTSINEPLKLTINSAESLSPLLLPFNSNILDENINVLVIVGGLDSPEFQRQSHAYSKKLGLNYHTQKLWVSSLDDHFTLVEKLSEINPSSPGGCLRQFIHEILK